MPRVSKKYRKRTKRATKAKKTIRSSPNYRASTLTPGNKAMVNLGYGFPKAIKITHKYVDTIALTCTSGVPQKLTYYANGMYAIKSSPGGGHQPLFFDQLTALYNHYTVIGSKITFKWVNASTSTPPMVYSLFVNDDTTQISAYPGVLAEQPNTKSKVTGFGRPKCVNT